MLRDIKFRRVRGRLPGTPGGDSSHRGQAPELAHGLESWKAVWSVLDILIGPELKFSAMPYKPISFANLYMSVLGSGLLCVCGIVLQWGFDMRWAYYGSLLSDIIDLVILVAGAAAIVLLTITFILRRLERKRMKELYRYMLKQAQAGAGVPLAVERTRTRMHLEMERAGGYIWWLLGRI